MTIPLALEIPESRLADWSPYTQLDFVLAHKVLESPKYARFFKHRVAGRELILDNSVHELGTPLDPITLVEAAERVDATYVISPDRLEDAVWTIAQSLALRRMLNGRARLASVLTGDSIRERRNVLDAYRGVDMLCLPYRRTRLEWFFEHREIILSRWDRIHLLGVSSLEELSAWKWIADRFPGVSFSVDTAKPVKWGLLERDLRTLEEIRHAPVPSKDLLDTDEISPKQDAMVRKNITFLLSLL